jgi:hypothetical protein
MSARTIWRSTCQHARSLARPYISTSFSRLSAVRAACSASQALSTAVMQHCLVHNGEVVPCEASSKEWLKSAPRGEQSDKQHAHHVQLKSLAAVSSVPPAPPSSSVTAVAPYALQGVFAQALWRTAQSLPNAAFFHMQNTLVQFRLCSRLCDLPPLWG